MVPAPLAGVAIDAEAGRGKEPLPPPLAAGVGVLAAKRSRQLDPAGPAREVALVLRADTLEMARQIRLDGGGQYRDPVLLALALRTTIWLAAKSTSWTRSRQHPSGRSPAP